MAAPPIFDMAENDAAGSEVQMWLEELGLGRYFGLLQAEGFDDFRIIRCATEEDVSELVTLCAMPRLHERQLRRALRDLHRKEAANGHTVAGEDEELVESNAGAGTPRSRGEPLPAAGSTWEVIGGRCAGGVLVRTAQDLKSPEASGRLGFRATVRELELIGTRLNFELVTGRGPKTGWVSIKVSGKDLLVRCSDPEVPSTCEATSDNEPPELEAHDDEEDEVLSVDDEVLTDTRTPNRWEEEVEEVEALSSESAEGLTTVASMDSERARGGLGSGSTVFPLQRGRLSKDWLKKDFELRPGGYAMMRRPVMETSSGVSMMRTRMTENSHGALPIPRPTLARPNVPVVTAMPQPARML